MTAPTSPVSVQIDFFGALREYGNGSELALPPGSSAEQIKQALAEELGAQAKGLIEQSVLADEEQILDNEWQLTGPARLAILPPVSGG